MAGTPTLPTNREVSGTRNQYSENSCATRLRQLHEEKSKAALGFAHGDANIGRRGRADTGPPLRERATSNAGPKEPGWWRRGELEF